MKAEKEEKAELPLLWFEKSEYGRFEIKTGPRIGVNFAGKCWAEKPYRFWFSKPKSGA